MSLLVVGMSHRSAPVPVLEQVVVSADRVPKVLHDLGGATHVHEALVLSTCNRVEVYAEVDKFHGGVAEITEVLARSAGLARDALTAHLYVHYEDRAVQHLFTVACGLDSMVVGEGQILGQLRSSFRVAREEGTLGRVLDSLVRQALRVGKRAHAETDIDRAGASLVGTALQFAESELGALEGRRAVLVGAGSMGALAGATLRRAGVEDITVVNRSPENASRLAVSLDARSAPLGDLQDVIAQADLLISSTGATGTVITAEDIADRAGRPLFVLDLALPRDVEPGVREIPAVSVVDLENLQSALEGQDAVRGAEAVQRIVTEEVGAFLAWERSARVAPTVVALRSKAAEVVDAELLRLSGRLPELDARSRDEVAITVRRVVDKLLHAPTVRVKELAEAPGGDSYAEALRELFDLDPATPEAVTRAAVTVEEP